MLWTNARRACVECGKLADAEGFRQHKGRRRNGPAYWSDEGLICSPACATSHFAKRRAQGREMREPAPAPGVGADLKAR